VASQRHKSGKNRTQCGDSFSVCLSRCPSHGAVQTVSARGLPPSQSPRRVGASGRRAVATAAGEVSRLSISESASRPCRCSLAQSRPWSWHGVNAKREERGPFAKENHAAYHFDTFYALQYCAKIMHKCWSHRAFPRPPRGPPAGVTARPLPTIWCPIIGFGGSLSTDEHSVPLVTPSKRLERRENNSCWLLPGTSNELATWCISASPRSRTSSTQACPPNRARGRPRKHSRADDKTPVQHVKRA